MSNVLEFSSSRFFFAIMISVVFVAISETQGNPLDPEKTSTAPISTIYSGDSIDYSTYHPFTTNIATAGGTTWIEQLGHITIIGESPSRQQNTNRWELNRPSHSRGHPVCGNPRRC